MPGNSQKNMDMNAHNALITVGSMSKYSAMPAQTPAIFRLLERVSFFSIVCLICCCFVVDSLFCCRPHCFSPCQPIVSTADLSVGSGSWLVLSWSVLFIIYVSSLLLCSASCAVIRVLVADTIATTMLRIHSRMQVVTSLADIGLLLLRSALVMQYRGMVIKANMAITPVMIVPA